MFLGGKQRQGPRGEVTGSPQAVTGAALGDPSWPRAAAHARIQLSLLKAVTLADR